MPNPAYLGGNKPPSRRRLWIGLLATFLVTLLVFAGLWLLPHLVCNGGLGQTSGCQVPPSR
jgi:hypothetical protein